jgi:hypothetical protein
MSMVLAVCGGGGSDTAALIVLLLAVLLWLAALRVPLTRVEDRTEGLVLVSLSAVSVVLSGLFLLYPHGVSGNGDYLLRFLASVSVTCLIGLGVAVLTRRAKPGHAVLVALIGDLFMPGFLIVGFFSSLLIGTGCLD